jgi:hypothetical protein
MRFAVIALCLSAGLAGAQPMDKPAPKTATTATAKTTTPGLTTEDKENIRQGVKVAGGVGLTFLIVFGVVSFLMQCLPIVIAFARGHPSRWAIAAVSFFLGWTCIGWVIALVWSLTGVPGDQVHRHYYSRR